MTTTHRRVWDESVLHSYRNLQNFFSSSEAIDEVLSRKDKTSSKVYAPYGANLDCRWKVCQIATAPFRYLAALVLKIVSKIARRLGANGFSKQMWRNADCLISGFNSYTNDSTKLFWLKYSRNAPSEKAIALNSSSPIPESRITDLRVKKRTFFPIYDAVKFNHNQGICRGMSDWFIYLYLNTKDQFSDPRSHMRALGRQFIDGGGEESTLLQSLYIRKGKLLGLKIGTQPVHSRTEGYYRSIFQHSSPEWREKEKQMVEELQNLPPGAYRAWVPRHAMVYIKISNNLGFFFDPNEGITEINGAEQGKKLHELMTSSLDATGETVGSSNRLDFIPVTKR